MEGFLFSLRAEGRADGTVDYYSYLLNPLLSYVRDRGWPADISSLDPTRLRDFLNWTGTITQELIVFFTNADQLSALVVMADYNRGSNQSVTAPFGAACQSILFGYAEAKKENPRGVIGFFDISQRSAIDRETLTFTIPYRMFQEMEASVEGSFLGTPVWRKLQERQ